MTTLERAILKTLAYADIFDYPLKEQEIWRYLIGSGKFSRFRASLATLIQRKIIFSKAGYFGFKKREGLVSKRLKYARIAEEKLPVAQKAARLLGLIPTVRLVGVSGALAMRNAPPDDDIDLFIITAPETLWTTRFIVTLLLDILNLRRRPGEKRFRNKICLNMYLDAGLMRLPGKEQDLYSAHEVAQLNILVNKFYTYEHFLQSNMWAKKFLPHAFVAVAFHFKTNYAWWGKVLGGVESILKTAQLGFMQKKRTHELISENLLRFHPTDARERVLGEYGKRLTQFD